ncbi:hypothetical protein OU415_13810 [Saccharopolyspora sp. WRP15-2]|uniref:Uncharacterized protein n=1 Tax=Saccharopolyspora oryzae TaxID=2997343 RepID=A0ABT4UXT7_9PSEU|nr:hypothetical protein [Saccharopolyspora oryzae]MDA3626517.1 hypothetical protein [Saccharopolyspora oryzae]
MLLLKLFLSPALVVSSTLAGRRWGPEIAGILVGLPVVAGPILFITHLQHGADFTSRAAASSLLGLVSIAVFAVVFSHVAGHFGWLVTLIASWAAVLLSDFALSFVDVTGPAALACTLAAATVAIVLLPEAEPERFDERVQSSPSWDLPGRALATGTLVITVTTVSGALGPSWTGLLAPFPIAISVVVAFSHAQSGPAAAIRTLTGALTSLFSFAPFCLLLSALVRPVGGAAFVLSAAAAVAVQLLVVRVRRALPLRRTT